MSLEKEREVARKESIQLHEEVVDGHIEMKVELLWSQACECVCVCVCVCIVTPLK